MYSHSLDAFLDKKLPEPQGWDTVYPMDTSLTVSLEHLAGGGMVVLQPEDELPTSIGGRKPPVPVRRALDEGRSLLAHPSRSILWWVVHASASISTKIVFVAWGVDFEGGGDLLQGWVDLLATSMAERTVSDDLTQAVVSAWDRLTFLYELAHIAGHVRALPEMLSSIVNLLAGVVVAEDVFLIIREGEGWNSVTASGQTLPMPGAFAQCVEDADRPIGLREIRDVLECAGSPLAYSGDILVAPLRSGGAFMGAIGLMDSGMDRFDSNDVQLIASVAEQVGALIQAAQARAERERSQLLEHELEIAAGIQVSLLPLDLPEIPGVELATYLQPARLIGGDFFDVVRSESGVPLFMLADVAGKGTPAAILTALVHATFHSQVAYTDDPAGLLDVMNRLLYTDLDRAETFITMAIVRLESDPLRITYASAGHLELALWRASKRLVEFYPATGLPLGINPQATFESQELPFEPGDVMVLYSDGLTETENLEGQGFGIEGLSDIIYAAHKASVEDQVHAILQGIKVHGGGLPMRDDIALILAKATSKGEQPIKVEPFVISAEVGSVRPLLERVHALEYILPVDQDVRGGLIDDFALALSEIVTNQIVHAYEGEVGRIQGCLILERDRLVGELYDNGKPYHPQEDALAEFDVENPPDRGYGLRLVRGLLDRHTYDRLDGGRNHWRLVKSLSGGNDDED
jgi:serine phosphatase RsbU (regulator of sigma subunit)/anti-sigma regulatory factor (Ser/Thr protein kinase)